MTDANEAVLALYRELVVKTHPSHVTMWPLISGHDCKIAGFKNWGVIIFIHTGNSGSVTSYGIGELPQTLIGSDSINVGNKEFVRSRLEKHFALGPQDGVVFIEDDRLENSELLALMHRHEMALGLAPMKIFLSHKGFDKPLVREFATTLSLLGFDPWLDEDAMPAGTNLERGILKGFADFVLLCFSSRQNSKTRLFLQPRLITLSRKNGQKGRGFL
jgi:TIR domain